MYAAYRTYVKHFSTVRIYVHLFPRRLSVLVLDIFYLEIFFFKTEKSIRIPRIKFNMAIISLKHAFHLRLHAAEGNTEEKHYETFHIFNLSLGPLNGVNSVNRSDLKISKQISPMSVCLSVTNVRTYTDILKNV